MGTQSQGSTSEPVAASSGYYRWYVLGLLVVIYAVNFVDRQIITILAPYLTADLGLTDAQIGVLYGTAFAMFYSLFGIPLARLADGWSRVKTLSLGLMFWSVMTTLSGMAGNFVQLGLARLGVGIGEASASPASISLLSDYFPKRIRGTILAIYAMGIYIGMGASMVIGGHIVGNWPGWFGLSGWQAAFIIVGLPGVFLGLLVLLTVREPQRGVMDGIPHAGEPHPFRNVLTEAGMMFPPWSIASLRRLGGDAGMISRNLTMLVGSVAASIAIYLVIEAALPPERRAVVAAWGPVVITTNFVQWFVIAVGSYAAFSWMQSVRLRDRVTYGLTAGGTAYATMCLCCGLLGIYTYSTSTFVFVYGTRYLHMTAADGPMLGVIAGIAGATGTFLGGFLGDIVRRRHAAGRIYLLILTMIVFSAATILQYVATTKSMFLALNFVSLMFLASWVPIMVATAQDLVIPRLRGAGFAVQTLASTLTGLGLGPYMVGVISDISGSLRFAVLSVFMAMPVLILLLFRLARILPEGEATVVERARQLGEPI